MNIAELVGTKKNTKIPNISPGDTVRVSARIVEAGKERIQVYQGVVLKIKKGGAGASFTVRHVAFGVGVERSFPMNSNLVEGVEIVREGKVRRARLYYLRGLSGKEARRKIKRVERKAKQIGEELLVTQPEEVIEPMVETPIEEKPVAAASEQPKAEVKASEAKAEKKAETKAEAKATEAAKPAVEAPKAEEKKE